MLVPLVAGIVIGIVWPWKRFYLLVWCAIGGSVLWVVLRGFGIFELIFGDGWNALGYGGISFAIRFSAFNLPILTGGLVGFALRRRLLLINRMKPVLKVAGVFVMGLLVLLGLQMFGIVGIFYIRPIENEPLLSPVKVASVVSNVVRLTDGRVLTIEQSPADLERCLSDSNMMVDLEDAGFGYEVFVKRRRFICGCGMPMITIPIIPRRIPINERQWLGLAMKPTPAPTGPEIGK